MAVTLYKLCVMTCSIAPAGGGPVSLLCANVVGSATVAADEATVVVGGVVVVVGVTVKSDVGTGVAFEPDAFEEPPHALSVDATARQTTIRAAVTVPSLW